MTETTEHQTSSALVTGLLDIIDRQRWDDIPTVLAEDCVVERPGAAPLTGLPRIDRFYREERPIREGKHVVEHLLTGPDTAACWGVFTGTKADGTRMEVRFAETYHLRAGRIVRRTTYVHPPAGH